MKLSEWQAAIHQNAIDHGWWEGNRSSGEIIALIHSEWSEALEEYRNGRPMVWHKCKGVPKEAPNNCAWTADKHCEARECKNGLLDAKPEGIAVEIIDGCIRILDYAEEQEFKFFDDRRENIGFMIDAAQERQERFSTSSLKTMKASEIVALLHWYTAEYDPHGMMSLMECFALAFAWVRAQGINPEKLMAEKHEYNKTRPYRHGGKVC